MKHARSLWRAVHGDSAIEYALIIALVSISIFALVNVGSLLQTTFQNVTNALNGPIADESGDDSGEPCNQAHLNCGKK